MDFYFKDESGEIIATFEYFTSLDECNDCKAIKVKKGSRLSKHSYCTEKWYDCKWVELDRQQLIQNNVVEDLDDEYFLLKEDVLFKSPVKALSIILGHIDNTAWEHIRNDNDESLKDVYRA